MNKKSIFLIISSFFFTINVCCEEKVEWNWSGWKAEITDYGCFMHNEMYTRSKKLEHFHNLYLNIVYNFTGDITSDQKKKGVSLEKEFITVIYFDGKDDNESYGPRREIIIESEIANNDLTEVQFEISKRYFGNESIAKEVIQNLLSGVRVKLSAESNTGSKYTFDVSNRDFSTIYSMYKTCISEEKRNKYNQQDSPLRGSPLL